MAEKKNKLHFLRVNWTYAGGEIAIVSIGIILAFQLNNWKQNRADRITEKESLNLLYNELRQDSAILYQYFRQANLHKADAAAILTILNTENPLVYADSLADCFRRCGFYSGNVLHRSAFSMMTARGNINLIRDDAVKNAIYKYYDRTHKVVEVWNDFEKEMVDEVIPQLYKTGVIDDQRVLETNGLRVFYKPEPFVAELMKDENRGRLAIYMRAQNEMINVTNLNRRLNGQLIKHLKEYMAKL